VCVARNKNEGKAIGSIILADKGKFERLSYCQCREMVFWPLDKLGISMRSSRHLFVVFVDNVERGSGDQIRRFVRTRKRCVNNLLAFQVCKFGPLLSHLFVSSPPQLPHPGVELHSVIG
jgi:hypothetical protein